MKDTNLFEDVKHINLSKKIGVYLITCKNHSYVGSSINLYYRLKHHVSDLRKDKHVNKFMQNCYNKYKDKLFNYSILEYCSKEEVRIKEKEWIDKLNPDINSELNPVTKELSKESKKQISETLKYRYKTKELLPTNMKPILVYKIDGTFIGEYISCSEVSRQLNLNFKKVSLVALGKQAYHRGYKFKYK
jgi:hypothetical protein